MSGPYIAQHKDEILELVRGTIVGLDRESPRAPSIHIAASPAGFIEVAFTEAQLAREVGRILHKKYWGELGVEVDDSGELVRVTWWR